MLRKFITTGLSAVFGLGCMLLAPAVAAEEVRAYEKPSAPAMMADLMFVRPLLLATTAVGSAVFVGSLPFSLLGGNVGEAGKELVWKPVNATLFRCLGCY